VALKDSLRSISADRADRYRELRAEQADGFTVAETGPCVTVVADRRTGELFEGVNTQIKDTNALHPVLRGQVDKLLSDAAQERPYDYGSQRPSGKFPHPSDPGTHSEIAALDAALTAREAQGMPVTIETLGEMALDNARLKGRSGPIPCCANCSRLTGDAHSYAGKAWEFPPREARKG
jgi:hypothetical protein